MTVKIYNCITDQKSIGNLLMNCFTMKVQGIWWPFWSLLYKMDGIWARDTPWGIQFWDNGPEITSDSIIV